MIVVSDTSPLNYLILIERVNVLPILFNRVVAPPAVVAELCHPEAPKVVADWASKLLCRQMLILIHGLTRASWKQSGRCSPY
jgi:predicted nucleic acid-binding protein